MLERLADERAGAFVLAKVNIDEAPDLAGLFGIQAIPAVKAFRDGKVVLDFVGVLPEPELREFVDRIFPSQPDILAHEARTLETADPQRAEALYRQALHLDRNHEPAIVGLARLLIGQGRDADASDLLTRTGPGGDEGAEVERLTGVLALRALSRGLDAEAVVRQRLQQDPSDPQALYELGCLLAAAGQYPEALELLLAAGEKDPKVATSKVREAMVKIFQVIGVRSALADEYRAQLSRLLY
jgi:putative thioredoxin